MNIQEKSLCKASKNSKFHFTTKDEYIFCTGDSELKQGVLFGNKKLYINYKNISTDYIISNNSIFGNLFKNTNFYDKIDFIEIYQIKF